MTCHYFHTLFIFFYCINCKNGAGSEKSNETSDDVYLFVALIDIVFTDGSKRTCTGTIIHDNVVITAAHCFVKDDGVQPELTASFVVIGTKKMFDSGYEQYLPIERIITHPNYKSWESDLALVYTFAGMMSDKPGRIARLSNERASTDFEVNVFSWGRCRDEEGFTPPVTETPCSDDEKVTRFKAQKIHHKKQRESYPINHLRNKSNQIIDEISDLSSKEHGISRSNTRYQNNQKKYEMPDVSSNEHQTSRKKRVRNVKKKSVIANKRKQRRNAYKMLSYYRNSWRRNFGDQKNELTVEVFTFLNNQACKKLVEKATSSLREINNPNEFICYTSEEHYITKEDSGSPAMRQGRIVAMTVGGVDCDGDRVAIGLKIVCFCSWIAENLPKSNTEVQCCKNCCETNDNENQNDESLKHTHKKKIRILQ